MRIQTSDRRQHDEHLDSTDQDSTPDENGFKDKEGSFLLSPKYAKTSKYGIFGNYISKGGDRVTPPDICFALVAVLFIAVPSSVVLFFT